MGTGIPASDAVLTDRAAERIGPRLQGAWLRVAQAVWAALFLICLVSAILSIVSLNTVDRVPAADLPPIFPWMNQEAVAQRAAFQSNVIGLGFSLTGFAFFLSVFRLLGSLSLFLLSVLVVRKAPHRLMAVLFAAMLAVMGAAGMWNNPMLAWASSQAGWMAGVGQMLNLLLWLGLVFLYAFPSGRFTPRWTVWLIIPLLLIVVSSVFDLPIFLNPDTWPPLLALLPNIIFIGVAFTSVLYRYRQSTPDQKDRLQGFVSGVSLLMVLYFVLFFLDNGVWAVTGQNLFAEGKPQVLFILISESLWFLLELVFAGLTFRSIFQKRLLEDD